MLAIVEISKPFQLRPGQYESRIMKRYWWLWFSIALLKVSLKEYSEGSYRWEN